MKKIAPFLILLSFFLVSCGGYGEPYGDYSEQSDLAWEYAEGKAEFAQYDNWDEEGDALEELESIERLYKLEAENENRLYEEDAQRQKECEADPACNPNCVIKGNIAYDSGAKIYHLPGMKYYDETTINEDYGERWFCSEEDALEAGWRKAYE